MSSIWTRRRAGIGTGALAAEAEVERLRAENAMVAQEQAITRGLLRDANMLLNQRIEKVAKLEAENAELRDAGGDLHFQLPIWGTSNAVAASQRWAKLVGPDKLNGGELQRLAKKIEALKARLAWFEEFAEQAHEIVDPVTSDLRIWEREHPKPE